jgi:hypothetical protein
MGMIVCLAIGVELDLKGDEEDAPDVTPAYEELANTLSAALRHSSAAEALQDAFETQYGERVSFSGWWVKEKTEQ